MGKERKKNKRFYVTTKDNHEPMVIMAPDEKTAIERWGNRTGLKAASAVVNPIGTQAETIFREKETKPAPRNSAIETK